MGYKPTTFRLRKAISKDVIVSVLQIPNTSGRYSHYLLFLYPSCSFFHFSILFAFNRCGEFDCFSGQMSIEFWFSVSHPIATTLH